MEKEIIFIEEKTYQQIKKDINKSDDYFTVYEWKKLEEKLS